MDHLMPQSCSAKTPHKLNCDFKKFSTNLKLNIDISGLFANQSIYWTTSSSILNSLVQTIYIIFPPASKVNIWDVSFCKKLLLNACKSSNQNFCETIDCICSFLSHLWDISEINSCHV